MIRSQPMLALAVVTLVVIFLAGCATGAPTVPTPTPPVLDEVADLPITTVEPVGEPALEPTATPLPEEPAPVPTEALSPSPEPNSGESPESEPDVNAGVESAERPPPPPDPGTGFSELYWQAASGRMEVALTFDAGAERGYAEDILDTLASFDVLASFGITGAWAEQNSDLVRRMVDDGHMIFNHTWSHGSFTGASPATEPMTREQRLQEIVDTEALIQELTGYETAPYFRPPYGDYDEQALADISAAGYHITVMWSCDSFGWSTFTAAEIVAHCADNAPPGAIILMHVHPLADAEALPAVIESLHAQGYELVTVEELLQP